MIPTHQAKPVGFAGGEAVAGVQRRRREPAAKGVEGHGDHQVAATAGVADGVGRAGLEVLANAAGD